MSRSKKGSKGPGHEYWSKRPGSMAVPGEFSKNRTHRLERLEAKKAARNKDWLEYCPVCDCAMEDLENHMCGKCENYGCECQCKLRD